MSEPRPATHVSPAIPCAAPNDTEENRSFLRERVLLFARVGSLISVGWLLILNGLRVTLLGESPAKLLFQDDNLLHLAGTGVFVALWAAARWRAFSTCSLARLESAGSILGATLFAAVAALQDENMTSEYQTLLCTTHILIFRGVVVPSTGTQTLRVGLVASVPTLLASALVLKARYGVDGGSLPWHYLAMLATWCAVAIVLSTIASRIIYGLRLQVREARRLGQYTLEEKIGVGGMGEVYRARHALLRRPTAIKLLRSDQAGEHNVARFEREVQLTSQLTHPNTIAIYDYGRTPDGVFYYAMEYLPGLNLEQLVRKHGPLPAGRVIHILRQVCASLAEAHDTGLIHRDIKAANVILCVRGGLHDVVKVVDFGLVKELAPSPGVAVSGVHSIAGTPHYLAPEAIRSPHLIDSRSDLYGVGVLAYYLLSGHLPFQADTFMDVCSLHLQAVPVPPSQKLGAPVPRELEGLVLALLEKDPARRPASAREVSTRLEALPEAREWSEVEARRWWMREDTRPLLPGDLRTAIASAATVSSASLGERTAAVADVGRRDS